MKICQDCQIEKQITEFNKQSRNYDGYAKQCKECLKVYTKNLNLRNSTDNVIDYKLIRQNITLQEKEYSDYLLKKIGYQIDSEFTIHQQFMMKYNLV